MPSVMPVEFYWPDKCRWNIGVDCPKHDNCDKCGWNPEVIPLRKNKARQAVLAGEEQWANE